MLFRSTVGAVRLYADCGTNQPFTPDAWFNALKEGHTFVTTGPMVDFKIETARPGDTITVTNDRPLKVRIRAWGLRDASAPLKLQLVQFGKIIQEISATNANQTELEINATVAAGHGSWLAAHVVGRDRSEAVTTPVYVVRSGFRFWDRSQAPGLLQKQLTVLDDIESAIDEAAVQSSRTSLDYWNRWPAEQSSALRERVSKMREVYRELQRDLEREVSLRKEKP